MDSFTGEIRILPYDYAPENWAFCNGQSISVTQNQQLFTVIGNTYGGDGKTQFRLPNLQGAAPMGAGDGPGLTARTLGPATIGSAGVTLSSDQMPAHRHMLHAQNTGVNSDVISEPSGAWLCRGFIRDSNPASGFLTYVDDLKTDHQVAFREPALTRVGGDKPHENMQPCLGMNFCISLYGEYPARE